MNTFAQYQSRQAGGREIELRRSDMLRHENVSEGALRFLFSGRIPPSLGFWAAKNKGPACGAGRSGTAHVQNARNQFECERFVYCGKQGACTLG
ncbi:MAG: hypothetical protein ACI853_000493 [Paracoccaceae bacterium]|jgi:hypothetical protein